MISKNTIVSHLVELCHQHGVKHIIFSPGSRNAPFTISFNEDPRFKCYVIPDERAAAFFALGLAQYTKTITAVCCTSGTAALNYAPALAEAYYQRIPILAITADRPEEWIDQGIGQSIRQHNVFENYILKSHTLPSNTEKHDYAARLINEVLLYANGNVKGPVHLNVPLYEPLYETVDKPAILPRKVEKLDFLHRVSASDINRLSEKWNKAEKKLIVIGAIEKDAKLQELISSITNDPSVVVLTETHGNLVDERFHPSIDRIIEGITDDLEEDFTPDILLTFGINLITKKLKNLLFEMSINEHWHIDPHPDLVDTYHSLTVHIEDNPLGFFSLFEGACKPKESGFAEMWDKLEKATQSVHYSFLYKVDYSDFYVYSQLMKALPKGTYLQMGNSAAVRYIQLISQRYDIIYHGNRGTSGIDGCSSTAAGAAWLNTKKLTVLMSGDVSFFYDINALWHKYLSPNLRIVIVNNRGGGIFRIIKGPHSTNQLEEYFESRHHVNAEYAAKTYDLDYFSANNKDELNEAIGHFFKEKPKASILEIFTPTEDNDKALKEYFKQINKALGL
jgi:2-succinyl-5-enolpyruvyl-6-hydroxy-3-cyclohexene-1-carboxylate synthase